MSAAEVAYELAIGVPQLWEAVRRGRVPSPDYRDGEPVFPAGWVDALRADGFKIDFTYDVTPSPWLKTCPGLQSRGTLNPVKCRNHGSKRPTGRPTGRPRKEAK